MANRAAALHLGALRIVHNATVPIDDEMGGGLTVRAGGAPDYVLKLSPGWFDFLISVASQSS